VDPEDSRAYSIEIDPAVETEEGFSIPARYRDYLFIREGQHFLRESQQVHITDEAQR
jgi:hypothetical protein